MDIEILRPFGPSIVKVQLPLEIINQMNDYTDTIVKDQNKSTELDHGKNWLEMFNKKLYQKLNL